MQGMADSCAIPLLAMHVMLFCRYRTHVGIVTRNVAERSDSTSLANRVQFRAFSLFGCSFISRACIDQLGNGCFVYKLQAALLYPDKCGSETSPLFPGLFIA